MELISIHHEKFQGILNSVNLSCSLQTELVLELSSKGVTSNDFRQYMSNKTRVCELHFSTTSFLANLFKDSGKLMFCKRYFTSEGKFIETDDSKMVRVIVSNTTFDTLIKKLSTPPADMTHNATHAHELEAAIFYSFLRPSRDINLFYEIKHNKQFCATFKRYRDRIRKAVYKSVTDILAGLRELERQRDLDLQVRLNGEREASSSADESGGDGDDSNDENYDEMDASSSDAESEESDLTVGSYDDDSCTHKSEVDDRDTIDDGDEEEKSGEGLEEEEEEGVEGVEDEVVEGESEKEKDLHNDQEEDDESVVVAVVRKPSTRKPPTKMTAVTSSFKAVSVKETTSSKATAPSRRRVAPSPPTKSVVASRATINSVNSSNNNNSCKTVGGSRASRSTLAVSPPTKTDTAADEKTKKKKKRKRNPQDYDLDLSERQLMSVDCELSEEDDSSSVVSRESVPERTPSVTDSRAGVVGDPRANTFFNLKKDYANRDLLTFMLRHFQFGKKNGKVCFSPHQLFDTVLAPTSSYGWRSDIESFTHIFMIIGIASLYAQLRLVLLMGTKKFASVTHLALLIKTVNKTTEMTSSNDMNSDREQSLEDKQAWCFRLIENLNCGPDNYVLQEIIDVRADERGYERSVAIIVRTTASQMSYDASFLSSPSSASSSSSSSSSSSFVSPSSLLFPSFSSPGSSSLCSLRSQSTITYTPRPAKKTCRNPAMVPGWVPHVNQAELAVQNDECPSYDMDALQSMAAFGDKKLLFKSGVGFKWGTHPLCFESCMAIIKAMRVLPSSRIYECGCGIFRLGLLLSCISKHTVVCTDLPDVIDNINYILSVPRREVVDNTDQIYVENAMNAWLASYETHSIVVFNAMDNTELNSLNLEKGENLFYRDRARCSLMSLKHPVAAVWTMSDTRSTSYRNKNHLYYAGVDNLKTVCSKLSNCAIHLCDYLNCTKSNADAVIASFVAFLLALLQQGKKTGNLFTQKTLAILPNRLRDARHHKELQKYFSLKFVSKHSLDWFQIGEQYEKDLCSNAEVVGVTRGFNANALREIGAVADKEFLVLQLRLQGQIQSGACASDDDSFNLSLGRRRPNAEEEEDEEDEDEEGEEE